MKLKSLEAKSNSVKQVTKMLLFITFCDIISFGFSTRNSDKSPKKHFLPFILYKRGGGQNEYICNACLFGAGLNHT